MLTSTLADHVNEPIIEQSAIRKIWATRVLSALAVDESTRSAVGTTDDGALCS